MSSFKNFAPTLRSLQAQADGTGTIAGSPLEDFLSIAGYETPGGGGGGSSDFSTATVTVSLAENTYINLMCPLLSQDGTSSMSDIVWYDPGTYTCTAILYKGVALVAFEYDGNIEVSDGVKYDSNEDLYYIDGDGTIALTPGGGGD